MNSPHAVLHLLHQQYPHLKYYLTVSTPLETLVGAILSAQVRDEVVNAALLVLFKKYKTAKDYAHADLKELTKIIKSITFAKNKAKNITAACQMLVDKYNGTVPKTVDELTQLPGIGKKTAHVILQNVFNIIEGVVVDTHVLRVSYRLGWTNTDKNADKSAEQLEKIIPKNEWKELPWLLKAHGRAICQAPVPKCSQCRVEKLCPKQGVAERK